MPEKKSSYPIMPISSWWSLRNRFKQSIPTAVTPGYLATVLNMKEKSAQTNILPFLVNVGIIDEEGKPLDRAKKWRDDQTYSSVCQEILSETYPKEVLEALPGPEIDRSSAERWFANDTGLGEVSARKMATFYEMLVKADPSETALSSKKQTPKLGQDKENPSQKQKISKKTKNVTEKKVVDLKKTTQIQPIIHVDIQIHISPDATADQIDQVFISMAKHLYKE